MNSDRLRCVYLFQGQHINMNLAVTCDEYYSKFYCTALFPEARSSKEQKRLQHIPKQVVSQSLRTPTEQSPSFSFNPQGREFPLLLPTRWRLDQVTAVLASLQCMKERRGYRKRHTLQGGYVPPRTQK